VRGSTRRRRFDPLVIVLLAAVALSSCGSGDDESPANASSTGTSTTIRLGYFPNVTHAPALVAVENGTFTDKLGSDVKLDLKTFNAGNEAVTAILAGALDATFVGPNPAINAFQKTKGDVQVVSGVASGGAYLVVKPEITSAADLIGKKVATPQAGNTQDVALRTWLNDNGANVTKDGGDVTILPQENSVTLTSFTEGTIDGAWVPEPWATRLVDEGGGKVLVDEKTLWPEGKYTTTVLLVTKKFLAEHPDVVENLISAVSDSIELIEAKPAEAQPLVTKEIGDVTGKPLKPELVNTSFEHITFTLDPIISSLQTSADNAKALGFLESSDLAGIFDPTLVNKVLQAQGEQALQP
jgi:NitT/TauT family transport system substrate-binding protein